MELEMHHKEARFGMWKSWSSWSSPVGLGIFLLTTALALAIFLYTVLNLVGAVLEASHPATASQGISAQEMQQLEAQSGSAGGSGTTMGQ